MSDDMPTIEVVEETSGAAERPVSINPKKLKKYAKYIGLPLVLVGAIWGLTSLMSAGKKKATRTQVAAPPPPVNIAPKPAEVAEAVEESNPRERQLALEQAQKQADKTQEAMVGNYNLPSEAASQPYVPEEPKASKDVYNPDDYKLEPYVYEPPSDKKQPVTTRGEATRVAVDPNLYQAYLNAYQQAVSAKPAFYEIKTAHYAPASSAGGEISPMETAYLSQTVVDSRPASDRRIPYLKVIPAWTVIGYNSDMGSEMVVQLASGPLRGHRLYGQASTSKYAEGAYFHFTTMTDPAGRNPQPVNAFAVDAKTRIPSVPGKVNRHLLHNTVFGFATSFFNAYGQTISVAANPPTGIFNTPQVDTDRLLQGEAISTASQTLQKMGQYRPPTLTQKQGRPLGVIFVPAGIASETGNNLDKGGAGK